MAYGRRSLNVFLIIGIVLLVLFAGGFLFIRYGLPKIIASAVTVENIERMDPQDRQQLNQGIGEVLETLDRYGLSREDVIRELREMNEEDFVSMFEKFSANPAPTPGDAAVFAVEELEIDGVQTELLKQDINSQVDQAEYEAFLESDEFRQSRSASQGQFAGVLFPVIRDAVIEVLESYN